MKNFYFILIILAGHLVAHSQTVYVPGGTSTGIANNTSNAFVGVGVAVPQHMLHVKTSGATFVQIEKASSSYEAGIIIAKAGVPNFWLHSDDSNDALKIQAANQSGEADMTPRIEIPFSNKNIYLGLSGGNIGIGTNSPQQTLDVAGIIAVRGVKVINTSNSANGGDIYINGRVIRNESTVYQDGMYINHGATGGSSAHVRFYANGTTERMRIDAATGNVGIGTSAPDAKLSVKGDIHSQAVIVDLNGAVAPDYVFEAGYSLPSLETVKSYISKYRHLPEVPSAEQMEKSGVNVGEMNLLLLKKVEELTLYLINQEEQTTRQQNVIDALMERVKQLEDK